MNRAVVVSIPDTTPDVMLRWAVLPPANPYVYVPASSREQAEGIARDLDRGARPETFLHRLVTERMREVYGLTPLPPGLLDLPHLPGFGAWEPVSAATRRLLRADGRCALLAAHIPGVPGLTRSLHLAAAPLGCSVAGVADEAARAVGAWGEVG